MPTNFPGALDNFGTVPESQAAAIVHRERHQNVEDAVEAVQAVVGVTGSTNPSTLGYKLGKLERENPTVTDYGATGQGIANDTPAFAAAVTGVMVKGGSLGVPAGLYNVGRVGLPGIEIDSPITGEPDVDQRSVVLQGNGAGNSVIKSMTSGQYAVKLTGGTSVDAHGYENHTDFSIVAGVSGANGLHLFNKAYTSLDGLTLQGCSTGLLLESVLSSTIRNVTCGNNAVYGCRALKGTGFSGVNSNTFDSCNFRSNVVLGFETEAFVTDLTFLNSNFENNGRMGQPSEGGCNLVFNGSEGSGGATFLGGYLESNGGGADLFLTNTGTDYVTVVLIGVNFNRNSATRYVTNCIKTAGKIRLITIGCAFRSYNGYTPDAGRKYIAGDSALIWDDYGSVMQDAVERPATLPLSDRIPFAGSVSSAGAAMKLPTGWTCSKLGTGSYRVTHNLGVASVNDYSVAVNTSGGGTSFVLSYAKGTAIFDVSTVNPSFASTDAQFDFTLTRT